MLPLALLGPINTQYEGTYSDMESPLTVYITSETYTRTTQLIRVYGSTALENQKKSNDLYSIVLHITYNVDLLVRGR